MPTQLPTRLIRRNRQHSDGLDRKATANLMQGSRRETVDGREVLVVPVIMLKSTVVMNGGLVPIEEIDPKAWDGVLVSVQHPDEFFSVSGQDMVEKFAVGRVRNTHLVSGALKGEAWIDVQHAERIHEGLIASLEDGERMDVSTGYFVTATPAEGVLNGKEYYEIQRELVPDHLALLPGEQGACSFEDGCGVRLNLKGLTMTTPAQKIANAIEEMLGKKGGRKKNARGRDDDPRQIISDLISSDNAPFLPDDMEGLSMLSSSSLSELHKSYMTSEDDTGDGGDSDDGDGGGGEDDKPDEDKMSKKNQSPERKALIDTIVGRSNMKAEALAAMETAHLKAIAEGLPEPAKNRQDADDKADEKANKDDKAKTVGEMTAEELGTVINAAVDNRMSAGEKADLVAKVVENSDLDEAEAKKMTLPALRAMAAALDQSGSETFYGARAVPNTDEDDKTEETPPVTNIVDHIRNAQKKSA